MDLPLFPLHTVLCPGVALPLHVFEERYKAMVERCLADERPFGVVLIREGRETGGGDLAVAGVGTVAQIREATRYSDGRFDLMTLGTQRFRLEGVDPEAEPYLVGQITPLGEVLGEAGRARLLGERVVQLFIRYLEMLQVEEQASRVPGRTDLAAEFADRTAALAHDREAAGEPWAIDEGDLADAYADIYEAAERQRAQADAVESALLDSAEAESRQGSQTAEPDASAAGAPPRDAGRSSGTDQADRAALLDEAARRLTIPDDPTVLSYLLSGIVQVESIRRQGLLEMETTELRLVELAHLLEREIGLLQRGLGTYSPDPRLSTLRRN